MIVVDVETTGTDPLRHAIISIGAIDFINPERQFYRECRIWPGAQIQTEALAINGATPEQVIDPSRLAPEDAIAQFIAFCREASDRTLAGHNTTFDRDFLQMSVERHSIDWHFGYRVIDLHSVAWMHMVQHGHPVPLRNSRSAISCDTTLMYCGLPQEPKPHNGLVGAKMEAEAFSRLINGKGLFSEYEGCAIPHQVLAIETQQSLF
jgi:DNA polymerase III epsilon subunit-like protein